MIWPPRTQRPIRGRAISCIGSQRATTYGSWQAFCLAPWSARMPLCAVPPGLNQDEASSAYDAYALLHYGIDRNGFHNPVAMVAWGSGMSCFTSYLMMPFMVCFGQSVPALRLPFLLAGAASILLIAQLAKRIHGVQAGRIAAFVLAVSPWHILMSRWAHEANLVPFMLLSAVLVSVLSLSRPWLLPVSFGLFGISLYTYGPVLVVVPLYLAILLPYAFYHRIWPARPVVVALLVLAILGTPVLLYAAVNLLALRFDYHSLVQRAAFAFGAALRNDGKFPILGAALLRQGRS